MEKVRVLAGSEDEAKEMETMASEAGLSVVGRVTYDVPELPGSFMVIEVDGTYVRMSTPEFFLFRKTLGEDASLYASEMLSHVATSLTRPSLPEGTYEEGEPQTNVASMLAYLMPILAEDSEWFDEAVACIKTLVTADAEAYEVLVRSTMEIATE